MCPTNDRRPFHELISWPYAPANCCFRERFFSSLFSAKVFLRLAAGPQTMSTERRQPKTIWFSIHICKRQQARDNFGRAVLCFPSLPQIFIVCLRAPTGGLLYFRHSFQGFDEKLFHTSKKKTLSNVHECISILSCLGFACFFGGVRRRALLNPKNLFICCNESHTHDKLCHLLIWKTSSKRHTPLLFVCENVRIVHVLALFFYFWIYF